MALEMKPHKYTKDKLSGQAKLTSVNNYLRITEGKLPPVFIQGGKFYSAGGKELAGDQLPAWVPERVKAMQADKAGKRALAGVKYGNQSK